MSKKIAVLLVDDDEAFRHVLGRELGVMGFEVTAVARGQAALDGARHRDFDVVLLDVRLPDMDGVAVLKALRADHPQTEVIMLTGQGTLDAAVHSMKLGAYDFLTKPCPLDQLQSVVEKAHEKRQLARENFLLRRQIERRGGFGELVGRSNGLRAVLDLIARGAPTDSTVLIQGESGTGKELVAQALHRSSPRREGPFVVVDCTSLREELLHSELFGHERGAFTGAATLKHGMFEMADGGTLFMDEIGDLPPEVQTRLLRVLEGRSFRRLGGTRDIAIDTRLVVATNRDLNQLAAEKRFREDLLYRIRVVSITVPPLRERREDIAVLARHFAGHGAHGRSPRELSPEAMALLEAYDWPGNVRELRNTVEQALLLGHGERVERQDLPGNIRLCPKALRGSGPGGWPTLEEVEKNYIRTLLDELEGNRAEAARALKVSERTLYRKLRQHGITP